MYLTRKFHIEGTDQLERLSRSSADLWNSICKWYWRTVDRQDHWLSKTAMRRWHCKSHNVLPSQTAQEVAEQFYEATRSWHDNDREGNPPKRCDKEYNVLRWTYQGVTLRDDGVLRLSTKRGDDSILIDWPVDEEPRTVEIGQTSGGFVVRAQYDREPVDRTTGDKVAGIDLGEKQLAAVFTGEDGFTINGGELRALRHYQNSLKAKLDAKIDRKEPGSNRWKKLVETKRKQLEHIDNKITDLLHKLSRKVVEMLLERRVSAVAIGDVRGIRDRMGYGKRMNQRLHQWAYGEFARMIAYKARLAGMTVERVDEAYTSQECPQCGHRKKPSGREYSCGECGFHGHRDVVGAANIQRKYVGSDDQTRLPGVMASPSGVRFHPHLSCSSRSGRKTFRQSV
ncbi:IS605 family transposase orfB [Salinibacter ruber M8]|uniref:IS605 family transposase orfB n=1 Tax=Salinibacter ruber (strain M8) TaxID=761659 RepID=D5H6L5_SALRM|nr:RNA-guided endonuclease TnpB family protein [Salinibacter ruber]CBH23670.1 IS605 family transposase orfB [Salinibacter ruber M8]